MLTDKRVRGITRGRPIPGRRIPSKLSHDIIEDIVDKSTQESLTKDDKGIFNMTV